LRRDAAQRFDLGAAMSKFLPKEAAMNKDELKGKAENLKGRVKEAFGSVTGDKSKQAEGFVERVKGTVREKFGKAKDVTEHEADEADEALRETSPETSTDTSSEEPPVSRTDRSVSREDEDE
jgi:uncharacterized protein YjbJ (UPF0337 family)